MCGRGLRLTIILGLCAMAPEPTKAEMATKLTGGEIGQLLSGKTIVFRHDRNVRQSAEGLEVYARIDGIVAEVTFFYRGDGSFRRHCKVFEPNGQSGPCRGLYKEVATGVWEIRGSSICMRDLNVNEGSSEYCYEVERAGLRYRWRHPGPKRAKGPYASFFDGIEFDVRP